MTTAGGVTVAIATRNRPEALDHCLEALRRGERLPAEVVIIDQSDDSLASDVARRHRAAGLTIHYERQEPRGLGAAQNVAFARARQPVVGVIDDDCVPDAGWLRVVEWVLSQRPDLDGVTGRVLPLDAAGPRAFAVSSRTSEVRREFSGRALPWEVGSGNNFALRRTALSRVGGCDERLGPGSPAQGGVDMDLFHRLLRGGGHLLYEPDAVVYHERQTRAERKARRPMYGRGMGTAIALWRRDGDPTAGFVLRQWVRLRLRQMRMAAARGDWNDVSDELTMLTSTVRGLAQGWKLASSGR
jgi:GT2 family glycosyltransferase